MVVSGSQHREDDLVDCNEGGEEPAACAEGRHEGVLCCGDAINVLETGGFDGCPVERRDDGVGCVCWVADLTCACGVVSKGVAACLDRSFGRVETNRMYRPCGRRRGRRIRPSR